MSDSVYRRTRLEQTDVETHRITADGARDVFIIRPGDVAPMVIVPETTSYPGRVFNLQAVRTVTHEWFEDDGLDEDDPDVKIQSSDHLDTVLIRGVAEHMVGIDHAPYVDQTPRLLVWTEYTSDDHDPIDVPL